VIDSAYIDYLPCDEKRRAQALDLASDYALARSSSITTEETLHRARAYEAYLKGEGDAPPE